MALDEASVVGIFPNGKAGTRCPPGIEYLGVWARAAPQPINEVEYQAVEVVTHKGPVNHRRSAGAQQDARRAAGVRGHPHLAIVGHNRKMRVAAAGMPMA
jgi:hypothetical protein